MNSAKSSEGNVCLTFREAVGVFCAGGYGVNAAWLGPAALATAFFSPAGLLLWASPMLRSRGSARGVKPHDFLISSASRRARNIASNQASERVRNERRVTCGTNCPQSRRPRGGERDVVFNHLFHCVMGWKNMLLIIKMMIIATCNHWGRRIWYSGLWKSDAS